MSDDWKKAWDGVLDKVGASIGDDELRRAPDRVDASMIRRYCEPFELDCPLHYDADVAREYGHPDIIAPYLSVISMTMPAIWTPGHVVFDDPHPDAQPKRLPSKGSRQGVMPKVTTNFATDSGIEFLRPVVVGDHLGWRGNTLIACDVKETSVGRGAFVKYEREIVDEAGEPVARIQQGLYLYDPHKRADK